MTGEIRRVTRIEQRINEAAKLGFTKIYAPKEFPAWHENSRRYPGRWALRQWEKVLKKSFFLKKCLKCQKFGSACKITCSMLYFS